MIRQKDPNQLKFCEASFGETFKTPFEIKMNRNNRRVIFPLEGLISIDSKSMSDFGRTAINACIAIGAMITKIKHSLSDEETIEQIRENIYMHYFLGLEGYQEEPLFDPSLLVNIRERIGKQMLDEMNDIIARQVVS